MKRLQALIDRRIREGESTRTIAIRAREAGHQLSHGYINELHRDLVKKAPDASAIEALAAGLGYDFAEVRRAVFMDWYGYEPIETAGMAVIAEADLTLEEREELDRMIKAWLSLRRETD